MDRKTMKQLIGQYTKPQLYGGQKREHPAGASCLLLEKEKKYKNGQSGADHGEADH